MNITLKQPVKNPAVITNAFGDTYIDYSRFGLKGHNGVDYAGNLGDPIFAMADGRVEKIAYEPKGFGHHIILRHDGFRTLYAHLKRAMVFRGDLISAEKQIAEMGYSGFVEPPDERGTHLHIGLIFDNADRNNGYGGYVDPLKYINAKVMQGKSAEPALEESSSATSSRKVKIINDYGANIRREPTLSGTMLFTALPGITYQATGRRAFVDKLHWREVLVPLWVAERDWYGNELIAEE